MTTLVVGIGTFIFGFLLGWWLCLPQDWQEREIEEIRKIHGGQYD